MKRRLLYSLGRNLIKPRGRDLPFGVVELGNRIMDTHKLR